MTQIYSQQTDVVWKNKSNADVPHPALKPDIVTAFPGLVFRSALSCVPGTRWHAYICHCAVFSPLTFKMKGAMCVRPRWHQRMGDRRETPTHRTPLSYKLWSWGKVIHSDLTGQGGRRPPLPCHTGFHPRLTNKPIIFKCSFVFFSSLRLKCRPFTGWDAMRGRTISDPS